MPRERSHRHIVNAPELGEGGGWITIIKWRHKIGDHVHSDDVLVHAVTETMVDLELPATDSGVLSEIFASEGEEVAAGHPLWAID
jgi:pyruvate/2-oxoglutarate dehydrogenase complex dihydrolipoamide acyltransferase (E2) component